MLPSLRAFLSGLIDYAGLFPPARLPLDRALHNYARYRSSADAWMLGRFICPAARLAEVEPLAEELFLPGPPWVFSVLGRGGDTFAMFQDGIQADLAAVEAFRWRHGERVVVDVCETKLPAVLTEADLLALRGVSQRIRRAGLRAFYEPAVGPDWRPALSALFGHLRGGNEGIKLRCGGLDASAFPTPEQVAFVLTEGHNSGLPLKCTAGLHHPIRHFDGSVPAKAHGFLNVFGAGLLANALGLTQEQVQAIVEDEEASHFGFDGAGFGWKDYHATTEEVAAARRQLMVSFGSCSFDEPRDDLRAMGLLQ
jgi:hypothetical protein